MKQLRTRRAAAQEKGETAGKSKQEQGTDMKGLLEYLQGKFDEQNKKMEKMEQKMDEQSRILIASIAENANRFQRIEENLKT